MNCNQLLKAIEHHCRPTTMAALIVDLQTSMDACEAGIPENITASLFASVDEKEGEALIEAERGCI